MDCVCRKNFEKIYYSSLKSRSSFKQEKSKDQTDLQKNTNSKDETLLDKNFVTQKTRLENRFLNVLKIKIENFDVLLRILLIST
ncbi:hypothetical protein LEP1GSC036_1823 [Leptospira weilii str. 2006001853]|uniref:Uncharacterized protein n=1 Tax=Leptospira weilii str. 2006001853 TaxID=1001589 RepID=A0A828YV74_9LEPT|nr:hypothetical protein LEP1GSC036_1823 [Leptospira weilii str. 2006001853]EMJ63343.1 hypothetical protein LEP1GSC051_2607 [Leptospira sp. P2653]EMN44556.1 hypothetical protein LEP1GSC086_1998 [Leptospira weilii str. LNT 1234]QDK25029.1 hypothetical protein FHG67_20230 [Leptospira weilii]QDK28931.1 hypothetical protein FHG68_19975 [Leptospira weilii]